MFMDARKSIGCKDFVWLLLSDSPMLRNEIFKPIRLTDD